MPGKGDRPAMERGGGGDRQRGGKGKSHKGDSRYRNYYNYDEGVEDEGGHDKGRRRQAKGGKKGGGGKNWKHVVHDDDEDVQGKGVSSTPEPSRSQLNSNAPDFKPSGYSLGAHYGGGWGVGQAAQPPPPAMPPLWKEFKDEAGTPYYYNSKTGLSQWERPPELEPPKPPPAPAAGSLGAADKTRDSGSGARGHRDVGGREDEPRRTEGSGLSAMLSGAEGGSGSCSGGCGGCREVRERDGGGGRAGTRGNKRRNNKPDDGKKEGSEFGPPGCNLFVFHLPDDWTDDDVHEYFAPHGNVVSAKVMKELGTGRSRGFGFVSYEDRVSAATALKKMQGYKILGKRLKVEFKKGEHDSRAEADDRGLDGASDDEGNGKKSYPDDERLIGYLRAISAKNVVKSLKESESGGGRPPDEDGQEDGAGGSGGGPGGPSLHETLFAPLASAGGGDDPASDTCG